MSEWTQRLEPLLQQQEEAPQFDIHRYSEEVIIDIDHVLASRAAAAAAAHDQDGDGGEGDEHYGKGKGGGISSSSDILFGDIVAGKPSAEVCRVFLACLSLINQGNLSVIKADNEKDKLDSACPSDAGNESSYNTSAPTILRTANGAKGSRTSRKAHKKTVSFAASPMRHTDADGSADGEVSGEGEGGREEDANNFAAFRLHLNTGRRMIDIEGFRAPSVAASQQQGKLLGVAENDATATAPDEYEEDAASGSDYPESGADSEPDFGLDQDADEGPASLDGDLETDRDGAENTENRRSYAMGRRRGRRSSSKGKTGKGSSKLAKKGGLGLHSENRASSSSSGGSASHPVFGNGKELLQI